MSQGKEHIKTELTTELVTKLYKHGAKQQAIADELDISVDTLYKYYDKEMKSAILYANANVAKSLHNLALHAENENARRASCEFWLRTRDGWKTQEAETLNRENESLKEELRELRERLDKEHQRDY